MTEIRSSTSSVKVLKMTARMGVQTQKFSKVAVCVLAVLSCLNAWGQSSSRLSWDPEGKNSRHRLYGQIRLEGIKYFTELPDNPKLNYSQFLSGQLSYLREGEWFDNAADLSAGTFFSQNLSHFVVHELYMSPRTSNYRFYLGRKKNTWSEMDRAWNLGLWQPYYELDALRPEAQGLTGLFLDLNRDNWQVLGFVTPISIPSMGAGVREEGGSLVSDSRWYHVPSNSVDFTNDRPMYITYKFSIPEAAKLAGHGGYALMARAGNKEDGFWLVTGYAYKPTNQLLLKRNIKVATTSTVGVIVSPDVTYHSLSSIDLGYTQGNLRATLSYLQDNPEEKLPETDWAIQRLYGLQAYSASVDWTLPRFLSRSIFLGVNYLHVDGGKIQDIVSDGSADDINLYEQRLRFTDAIKVKVQGELARISRRPLVTKFSYLYDWEQKGSMINTEFLFYPDREWAFVLGADFLGAEEDSHNESSFLNQFRANDRVYGGMTYVF